MVASEFPCGGLAVGDCHRHSLRSLRSGGDRPVRPEWSAVLRARSRGRPLQRHRVPRWLGALLMLGAVIGGIAAGVYALRVDVVKIVADLPDGARRLRTLYASAARPSTIESLRRATEEIDRTAAEAAGTSKPADGVMRVRVEEPPVRTVDYVWSGSMGL